MSIHLLLSIINIIIWLMHSIIHFSYTILCSFILYCMQFIHILIYGIIHSISYLFFNCVGYYLFVRLVIIVSVSCGLLICVEIMNKCRYTNVCTLIKQKHSKTSDNNNNKSDDDRIIKYSSFLKKHVMNDNFLTVFKSYYPTTDSMSKIKVQNVIKKYIYNIDPSCIIDYSQYISDSHISIIRTINQLTSKYEKTYIFDNDNTSSDNKIFFPNKMDDVMFYQNSLSIILRYLKYFDFIRMMRSQNYHYIDVNSNIRVWEHESLKMKLEPEESIINFVFLSNAQIHCMINKYKKNNSKTILSKRCIYIEIKGFTDYCTLFDMITMDIFNEYSNLETITRNLNQLFNKYVMSDIHIYASDITTIIIPFIVNYFQERIHTIQVTDPIFYPYNFQTFFVNLRHDELLKMEVGCRYNLMYLLDNLSLIDMYIDPDMCDKNENMLYHSSTFISFSDDSYKFIDKNNLIMMLELYSDVSITN